MESFRASVSASRNLRIPFSFAANEVPGSFDSLTLAQNDSIVKISGEGVDPFPTRNSVKTG